MGLKKPMEDEVSGGTRERYRRLLAVVQETEEGERISDQNSPNIAKHESGSEEKGVQEDDLKRRQAAQTHTHTHTRKASLPGNQ